MTLAVMAIVFAVVATWHPGSRMIHAVVSAIDDLDRGVSGRQVSESVRMCQ